MLHHLACIMDGNRRWAKQKSLLPWYGHKEGIEAIERVIDFCLEHAIAHLSLFAFAIQNFKRPQLEIDFLFSMIENQVETLRAILKSREIKITFIGDRTLFPLSLADVCEKLEQETAHYTHLCLNIFFCYGGQEEIVDVARRIAGDVKEGKLSVDAINIKTFSSYLWTHDIPYPDFIIRTGRQQRLSNFLLFQAAHTELYFLDCLWPDISRIHLQEALTYYNNCTRNFGV